MAFNINTEKSQYYTKLSGDVKERYDEKIRKCGGVDPYTIKQNDLSTNQKDFPEISLCDIRDYMIHTVSPYTNQFLDNYKGTEAYSYFESGFILNIGSKKNDTSAIVKGKVKHSQRMNEPPLQVWILANFDGSIVCAHCTCVAGLSETCSHVGAICFATNKIAESREIRSSTDVLCKWNVPSFKEVSMSSAINIQWRFASQSTTDETSFLEYCDSLTHISDERINQFVIKCHSIGNETALGTILFSSEVKRKTNLRDEIFLASLYNENYRNKTHTELVQIGKATSLNISNDEAKEICSLTLPRLKSKCSLGFRRGRITGSNFKICCVANIEEPSVTTIRRVINPTKNLDHVPNIKYQIRNKKKAIQHYNIMAVSNHDDFVYEECGVIINPDIPYFAGSPDGLVSCNCHGEGCIEIKCLNIQESGSLDEFLTRKPNNIMNKDGNEYSLEKKHEFFYHVQLQINVSNLKYCDCVIWSPQKPLVLTVKADIEFWKVAMEKAFQFHEQVLMPELLGKFYTRKKDLPNSTDEEEVEVIALQIEILSSTER